MDTNVRRQTLRKLSTGVYVLTSRCADRYGAATVTWVSQASFRPPLIMAAVGRQSNVFGCLEESRIAALHIVADGQQDIARRFCCRTDTRDGTINGEPFAEGKTAAPVLANLPAHIECRVEQIIHTDGDHALVLMRVVEAECRRPFRPLTIASLRAHLDLANASKNHRPIAGGNGKLALTRGMRRSTAVLQDVEDA